MDVIAVNAEGPQTPEEAFDFAVEKFKEMRGQQFVLFIDHGNRKGFLNLSVCQFEFIPNVVSGLVGNILMMHEPAEVQKHALNFIKDQCDQAIDKLEERAVLQ